MANKTPISDSDFVPESSLDSDTESLAESVNTSVTTMNTSFLDKFTEGEIAELTSELYVELDEYMNTHILLLRNPTFYEDMKSYITELTFQHWIEFQFCEDLESDMEEVAEFVEQHTSIYLDVCGIEPRSILYESTYESRLPKDNDAIAKQIAYLQEANKNLPKQKTKEWHDFRNGLITASNLWKVFGSESQVNSLIYEKCSQYQTATKGTEGQGTAQGKDRSNSLTETVNNIESATHWGVKYEPLTVLLYEHIHQTKVAEFGCLPHPDYDFIGASPDGINIDPTSPKYGRMIEIKNIKNREITGIPKEEYWVQTQGQMQTCGLSECDFVETRFLEYATEAEFYDDTEKEYKGVVLGFMERNIGTTKPSYFYMPLDIPLDAESVKQWIRTTKEARKSEDKILFSVCYWYLDEMSCVLIPRNEKWFEAALPKIKAVWETIEHERVNGYEHRNAKKRQPKTQVTQEPDGYTIHNLTLTNSICLIKMDEHGNPV
jgi:putative phage-type endonuclease